jgi:glycerophosphoryl diester phosphodiesterase
MPHRTFSLIAHRGSPLRAPENTLSSFLLAEAEGATAIETDIQLTSDGIPVLCHDNTLQRYRHGPLTIGSLTLAELQHLDFGGWHAPDFQGEPLLTLEALLRRFGTRLEYHLELKDQHPDTAAVTMGLLNSLGLEATITSFHLVQLQRLRQCHRNQAAGWLVHEVTPDHVHTARDLGLQFLCPKAETIVPETFALTEGFQIRAWGCPREAHAARATVRYLQSTPCIGITVDELRWFNPDAC